MSKPVVRIFNLIAVLNLLLEHTVAVADSVTVSRIVKRCKGIKETGCKTAKTAVTKTCIRFLILNHIIINVHSLKDFLNLRRNFRIDKVVAQGTSHKEFC